MPLHHFSLLESLIFGFLALLLSRVVLLGPTSIGQTEWAGGLHKLVRWCLESQCCLGNNFGVWLCGRVGRGGGESRIKAFTDLSGSLLILLLPTGVLAQEVAPAKLIVYLQRFRPQDYQCLLEVHSSRENPQGTKDADSSLD